MVKNKRSEIQSPPTLKTNWYLDLIIKNYPRADAIGWNSLIYIYIYIYKKLTCNIITPHPLHAYIYMFL